MIKKHTKYFFVYGTLKVGGYFANNLDVVRKSVEIAKLPGFKLYDLGAYPGILQSDNKDDIVYGEVHSYTDYDTILKTLDKIEGYNQNDKKESLYYRKIVIAETETGALIPVWVYIFNKDSVDSSKIIESGVWKI